MRMMKKCITPSRNRTWRTHLAYFHCSMMNDTYCGSCNKKDDFDDSAAIMPGHLTFPPYSPSKTGNFPEVPNCMVSNFHFRKHTQAKRVIHQTLRSPLIHDNCCFNTWTISCKQFLIIRLCAISAVVGRNRVLRPSYTRPATDEVS